MRSGRWRFLFINCWGRNACFFCRDTSIGAFAFGSLCLPFQAPNRSVCIIGTVCSFISFVFALCFASSQVDQALRTHVALSVAPTPTNTLPGGIRTADRISAAHELFLERNPENIIGSFVYESVPGTQSLRQQA